MGEAGWVPGGHVAVMVAEGVSVGLTLGVKEAVKVRSGSGVFVIEGVAGWVGGVSEGEV